MLKVLIADDEELIRRMIEKMIDWKSMDLSLVGSADNGLQVLSLIKEKHPDIVITDIRMPGIDGLEMIAQACAMAEKDGEPLDFVIISGYRNFEYAHQALTMGVRHYLLKPIDRAELSEALEQILRERKKSTKAQISEEIFTAQEKNNRKNARQRYLNSILEKTGIGVVSSDLPETGLDFSGSCCRALFAKIDWTEEREVAPGLLEILRTVIEKEVESWGCEAVSTHVRSGIISVMNYQPGSTGPRSGDIETLYTKCRKETDKFSGYTITFGMGTEKQNIGNVRFSIEEAVYAVKCRIRKGLGRVIFFEELHYRKQDIRRLVTAGSLAGIKKAIESLDANAVNGDLQFFSEQIRSQESYSPVQLYELIEQFTSVILEVWRENNIEESVLKDFSLAAETLMDRCTTEGRLLQRFEDNIELFFRRVLQLNRQKGQAPVREAKQYLSDHFRENLSLEEVAAHVGMSTAYFSTLFKKELGIGFSEYLIQLRCDEAKRLMRTSRDSLTVISEAVGYQDAKYFSRIFRRTVGLKPSEYRKLYQ